MSNEEKYARELMEQYRQTETEDRCAGWLLLLLYAMIIIIAFATFSSCRTMKKELRDSVGKINSNSSLKESLHKVSLLDSGTKLFKKDSTTNASVHDYKRKTTIWNFKDSSETVIEESGYVAALQTNSGISNQSNNFHRADSNSEEKQAKAEVEKEEKEVTKSRQTKGLSPVVYGLLFLLVIGFLVYLYIRYMMKELDAIRNIINPEE